MDIWNYIVLYLLTCLLVRGFVYICVDDNDYIPFIHLPMDYYYDEEHIWPSERLYRYINRKFCERLSTMGDDKCKNKKGKKRKSGEGMYGYGACSLFG